MNTRRRDVPRRKRGTPTVQLHVTVDPDLKARIDRYAELAGVPTWAVIEAAIEAGQPGPTGVPENWDLHREPQETLLDQMPR